MKDRIPKIPHWRWVLYHAIEGKDHPDIGEEILQLKRYVEEEDIDVGLTPLRDPDEHVQKAIDIANEDPIRRVVEHMLFKGCDNQWIRDVVYTKFKTTLTDEVLDHCKNFFWDTENLNAIDFARHYEKVGLKYRPDPPPVPGKWRSEYVAFKQGADVKIDSEDAIKYMALQGFFRAQELSKLGVRGDDLVLKYQKNALRAFETLHDMNSGGEGEIPDEFNIVIEYPNETAIEAEDIGEYDPEEDSGYEEPFDL